jgi:hypothetical protein
MRFRAKDAWKRIAALVCGLSALTVLAIYAPAGVADEVPSFPLYYAFQIPSARPEIQITSNGSTTNYTGKIGGTLGGLPIKSGTFDYGGATNSQVGGGWFALTTDAGTVSHTELLMAVDGSRTSVLFFGTYLGVHIEFRLASTGMAIGGVGQNETGLADTGFASQSEYVAAVQAAVASLPAPTRQQLIDAANTNAQLVLQFQQKSH